MRAVSINKRLITVLTVVFIGFALVSTLSILGLQKSLLIEKRIQTQRLVESAHSLVMHFYQQSQMGYIPEEQAKTLAIETLKALRYGGDNYFWINDHQPTLVMHPYQEELVGKDLSGVTDANGKFLFNEFVEIVDTQGEGHVSYLWPKPEQTLAVEKISYVTGFSPWDWIIGSGIYVDDIEQAFLSSALFFGVLSSSIILLVFTGVVIISRESSFQKQAFDVMKGSHEQLEHQVTERTALLEQANSELEASRDQTLKDKYRLEDSEALFRGMTEAAQDAIILIDANAAVVYWNQAAEHIFGFSASEIQTQNIIDMIGVEHDRERLRGLFANLLDSSVGEFDRKTMELKACRKSGEVFPIELSISRLMIDQNLQLLGIIRDITARKLAEQDLIEKTKHQQKLIVELKAAQQQLLQSEKLAAIGQLSAGVAHEINNPVGFISSNINSLKGYINELMAMFEQIKLQTATLDNSEEFLQRIAAVEDKFDFNYLKNDLRDVIAETKEGAARIQKIVADLKGFARASDDLWEQADLAKEIDSTLNVVWNELKYHCTVEKHYGQVPQIECLRSELNQVFMNLLINASHAITDKGTISITTGADETHAWVEIADTGKGIPAEILSKIFDPFFTTKPVGKGTGLGLSVSYGIIEKHAGTLEVSSEVGVGTTFKVRIPLIPNRPEPVQKA